MSDQNFTDILEVEGVDAQGYGKIAKIPMRDRRLTPEAKAIYAYIASFAGAGASAFPSAELMQYELDMSEQRYLKHRKLLITCGYIRIKQEKHAKGTKEGGRFKRNIYTLVANPVVLKITLEDGVNDAAPLKQGDGSPDPYFQGTENRGTENKGYIINSPIINSFNKEQERKKENKEINTAQARDMSFDEIFLKYLPNADNWLLKAKEAYLRMRYAKRELWGKLTNDEWDELVGELATMCACGASLDEIAEIIRQAVKGGYKGFVALKKNEQQGNNGGYGRSQGGNNAMYKTDPRRKNANPFLTLYRQEYGGGNI